MKRKKQRLSLGDLGKIPVTPAPIRTSGYEDSKTLLRRLQQEERDAALAPVREAQKIADELKADIAAENAKLGWYAVTPVTEMTNEAAPTDILTSYELRPEGQLPPMALEFKERWDEAYSEFAKEIDAKGIVFHSKDDVLKLTGFVAIQFERLGIALTAANFWLAFRKLYSLGALPDVTGFVETEGIPSKYVVIPVTEPAAPQKRLDPIEHGSHADAVAIIESTMKAQWQGMYRQFAEFMEKTYGVNVLQQRIVDFAVKWAEKWNKSLANPTHLNELRRALDYQQLLGVRGALLSADERTARALEDTPLTTASFETRQDITSRLKGLAGVD